MNQTNQQGKPSAQQSLKTGLTDSTGVIALPADYYRRNFDKVLSFIKAQYLDLLGKDEIDFINQYEQLNCAAQCLLVRLIMRKGIWFRVCKLQYAEIRDVQQAVNDLAVNNFLLINPVICDQQRDAVLKIFTKAELTKAFALKSSIAKSQLQILLAEFPLSELQRQLNTLDTLLMLKHEFVVQRFILCFFGNLYQDLTEFVLSDLAITRYEAYPIDQNNRFFKSRGMLDDYQLYYQLQNRAESLAELSADELQELLDQIPNTREAVLQRRYQRFNNKLARQLERLGALEDALRYYQTNQQPPARERQARIQLKLQRQEVAIELVINMLQQPQDEAELQVAEVLARKLKLSEMVQLPYQPEVINIELHNPASGSNVEQAAATYFSNDQQQAIYCENVVFNGLFGLLFWDIIFSPIQSAFIHPFQRGPLDLFSRDFYLNRQPLIEQRLQLIENNKAWLDLALACFSEKQGTANWWVAWPYFSQELLEQLAQHIDYLSLLAIFKRLVKDPKHNRAGFPDLLVLKSNGFALYEVKAPGDKLQDNQRRWMAYFNDHGIEHKLVKVSWLNED